jgi:hypothetical protein
MANTYTQIYIHIVFAVQGRQNLIRREHIDELQKYITGIISGQGQKLIRNQQHAESFSHPHRPETERRAFRFGSTHQNRIVRLH